MRIDNTATITVTGKGGLVEAFRSLKKGGEISARIVERIDAHRAVIEVAGRRITAGFVRGLPPGNLLTLVLEKRSGATLVFRLATADPQAAGRERLLGYTAFGRADSGGIPFARAAADGISGVYAYNSLLFRLAGGVEKKGTMVDVLNALAARGIKKEHVLFFSFLFSDFEGISLNCLVSALAISDREGRRRHNLALKSFAEQMRSGEGLDGVLDALNDLVGEDLNGGELLRQLLQALHDGGGATEIQAKSGVFYYLDDGFKEARYIGSTDSIVAMVDLSKIGRVEVLAKDREGRISIDVYCENESFRADLGADAEFLAGTIEEALGRGCSLSVNASAQAVLNIRALGALLSQGGEFDARA
ncbi:MAG: hypothetical protein MUC76_04445 [Spirochaetes bacterium]|jgi:hypothetical protein|nr:hypothetical protein [Spirochaetota bacterium]